MWIIRFCLLLSLISCAFIKRDGDWGKNTFKLRAKNVGRAFIDNARDPHVWAPLIGAGVLGFSKQDQKISDWASEKTPVFGSKKVAHEESNEHEEVLEAYSYASLFLTRSWDGGYGSYVFNKAKGGVVMYYASSVSHSATNGLKTTFNRERPNKGDHKSMPSGHSSRAATYNLVIRRNLQQSRIHPFTNKLLLYTSGAITAATMWARVEAKMHYTSDILVGYSLGNFVGGTFFDALMNLDKDEAFALYPNSRGDLTALYSVLF